MKIPISDRCRKYGYLFWPKSLDEEMKLLLADATTVRLYLQGSDRGQKNIDWKNRRISIGPKWTRELPETTTVFLLNYKEQKLRIVCR